MKLSTLYTNKPTQFKPIVFNSGFNAILGQIQTTADKDTHNLGKSLLVQIIDFCFLRKKDRFSLVGIEALQDFTFYLEVELAEQSFVTIARNLSLPTKTSFKYHTKPNQDFRGLLKEEWDQFNLPFETAKIHLDGLLNLSFLGSNSYRKFIGYLLRGQADFNDPFQLSKNRGKDVDWKPLLAKLLGFNESLTISLYAKKAELEKFKEKKKDIEAEAALISHVKTVSDVEGEINIVIRQINSLEKQLEDLNFGEQDKETISKLVDEINEQISELNDQLFYAETNKNRILKGLQDEVIIFNPDEAQKLFEEAGVIFDGQIKREFSDLIQFHKAISNERRTYLEKELAEIKDEIENNILQLDILNKEKAQKLSYLAEEDVLKKYKELSNNLVAFKSKLINLEQTKALVYQKEEINQKITALSQECTLLEASIRENVNENVQDHTKFGKIRQYFSEIIKATLNKDAYLTVNVNNEGNLEFSYRFSESEGHRGHTYKKLLCIAFDMALARVYIEQGSSLFLVHDGIFESLDNRVKERLLNVVREYSQYGLQQIITLIDSEFPYGNRDFITKDEIILTLHDKDDSGRLFKLPEW